MSKKDQQQKNVQKSQNSSINIQKSQISFDKKPKISQNHLSSSHERILQYEETNYGIQYLTKSVNLTKQNVDIQFKEPLVLSSSAKQQLFQKYGSMIQNQPMFLREIIHNYYLNYLPNKFQNQFSQIMVYGVGFQILWWGSLGLMLFRGYRNRGNVDIDVSKRQKILKFFAIGFGFLASSMGFYQSFYTPKLKECYYKNLKTIDSLMEKHINILKKLGKQELGEELKEVLNENKKEEKLIVKQSQNNKQQKKDIKKEGGQKDRKSNGQKIVSNKK